MATLSSTWNNLLADIRYTLRGLRNAPGYAITVVFTLALGLGAVTTVLAIVDSVLVRPVALPHPEQLVMMSVKGQHDEKTYALSYERIEELHRKARSLAAVGGYNTMPKPIGTHDGTRIALVTEVTPRFFKMLGVRPRSGRLLDGADAKNPVAIVSAAFWRERLHSDPGVIGSAIMVSGQSRTVVGVLPEGIHFPQGIEGPVVYIPISLNAKGEDDLLSDQAIVMGRLKPGVSRPQALQEARSILSHSQAGSGAGHETLEMFSYQQYLTGDIRTALLALLGGVGVLLLIACTNVANLQIARATGRMEEMNVRSALGASFGRLLQQVMTESLLVSIGGGLLGCLLSYALVGVVRRSYGEQFSRFDELAVHPVTFGVCTLLALLAGVLASLAPALSVRWQIGGGITSARSTRRSRLPGILVALQIALTCVLLVTGGLFVRTFLTLQDVKLGFDPRRVTTLVVMPGDQNKDPEASRQTIARLLERFETLPGVESATMQTSIPFSDFNLDLSGATEVSGRVFHEGDTASYSMVSNNFVHSSGLHLMQGREFLPQDDGSAALVGIVNEAFVKQYLPGRNPIGASVKFHRDPGDKDSDLPFTQALTVVGVVENELQGGDLGAPYRPIVYTDYLQLPKGSPLAQSFSFASEFAVRSQLPQSVLDEELRAAIKQVAPDMTEMKMQSMEEGIARSLNERRLALRLVSGFGVDALILAAIGIYGVLAYSVAQRRKEIGIRMALGSSRANTVLLVARQAGIMVFCGLLLGGAGAWPVGRGLRSFLFGVDALDPWTLGIAASVLSLVSAAAAVIPAWRASQVDPIEALRAE
jgi:putative ABC transport system permease protein